MNFNSNKEVNNYLKTCLFLDMGSQGSCYYRKNSNDVLKIFNYFDEKDYINNQTSDEILRFSNIDNNTFIWPTDIITMNNKIIGYISPYIKANNLYKMNPLTINLNTFTKEIIKVHKDIKLISQKGIVTYDMMYNTLYNKKFYVIDEDEYSFSDKDTKIIENQNKNHFNYEIYYFLVDNLFNNIIDDNKDLKELYKYKKEDVLIFIKLLRQRLSELSGKEITCLKDAKEYIASNDCEKYIRCFYK